MNELLAEWTALANPGCTVVILSATQEAARRVTEAIGQRLAEKQAHSRRRRGRLGDADPARERVADNQSAGVSAAGARARPRRPLVVLDEAGFMPSELWTAAHYIALDERANGPRIVMCGTPWGPMEHFFRQALSRARRRAGPCLFPLDL